nr:hypothetical protein [Rudanella lutea]
MSVASPNASTRTFQPIKLLACVLVAGLFWLLNALNKDGYSLNVEFPVRFVYNDSMYVPTSPLPKTVMVNVSGNGWNLLGHSWMPFRTPSVDYVVRSPLRESTLNTSAMTASLSEQIKNLRVNYVIADTLELGFEQRMTRTIHLVPDSLHLDMAPRFVVTSLINIRPETITVEGPRRLIQGLSDTLLVRIPGKRIADNYDEEVPINHFRHPLLKASANRVSVSFEVGELLSTQ